MNIPLVDLKAQYQDIKGEIDKAIQKVIESTQFAGGEELTGFEKEFAEFCGVKYGVTTSSGSTALDLTLLAFGIGEGDEVITTPATFIATSEAITHTGASIVFADIEPDSYNIDPKEIEKKITSRTRALIPVHLFGQPCDMDPIIELARKHNLILIEDAAQSHGAEYKGKRVGQFGDASIFSFYPGKNLGAYGHAGIVVTDREDIADKVILLANHGRHTKYEHSIEGYNYQADAIQTAVLRVKLKHLLNWNEKRRRNAKIYNSLLEATSVITPKEKEYAKHVYHLYVIKSERRDELAEYLNSKGISTGIHYPIPLHLQPAYKYLGLKPGSFPVTEEFCSKALSLPMFPELKEDEIRLIVEEIKRFFSLQ
ncbi:DegT/DnrJ/EryC1/StrS family aminotransferase [candidate division WOR-3 bacterium]|nr:DegT/DnrJ/EryC1/StrS family aminotransferase [candidate division WOR-3 bacterium]